MTADGRAGVHICGLQPGRFVLQAWGGERHLPGVSCQVLVGIAGPGHIYGVRPVAAGDRSA